VRASMGDVLNMSLDDIIKKNKEEAGSKEGASRPQQRSRGGRARQAGENGAGRPAPASLKVAGSGVRKAGSGRGRVLVVSAWQLGRLMISLPGAVGCRCTGTTARSLGSWGCQKRQRQCRRLAACGVAARASRTRQTGGC